MQHLPISDFKAVSDLHYLRIINTSSALSSSCAEHTQQPELIQLVCSGPFY